MGSGASEARQTAVNVAVIRVHATQQGVSVVFYL